MKATDPKAKKTYEFEMEDIVFVVEQGTRCFTMFKSGTIANLPQDEMKEVLKTFPAVYSDDFKNYVHINTEEISKCEWDEFDVTIDFQNGSELLRLRKSDFEKNVLMTDTDKAKKVYDEMKDKILPMTHDERMAYLNSRGNFGGEDKKNRDLEN